LRLSRPLRPTPLVLVAFAAVLIAGVDACAEAFRDGGSTSPAVLAAHADQLFDAAAIRFSPNELSPHYDAARMRLAAGALIPSRVFDDTSLWDARPSATRREIFVQGTMVDGKYRLEQRPGATPASRLGDTRHSIVLERLTDNVYRWTTRVDLAIGSISAGEASDAFVALLASAQNRDERALRDDYRSTFPRSMASFGKGFTLDSARMTPGGLGTTSVTMTFSFRPELMRASYPALSGYLDKYLGPAKYHFVLSERSGGEVFDVLGRDRAITLRYRVQQGKLVSLLGPPRPLSDTLQLTADVSLKVKHLSVGFRRLVAEFAISNSGHDRAWTILAQHEPDWDLPLLSERLIRSPLHRPFEPPGALFRLSVRDTGGASSLFTRSARLDVQESAIMRFLGSLASHAMGDIDNKVEADEHRFLHDGFVALQADLRSLRR
jgi:hypothetical protein